MKQEISKRKELETDLKKSLVRALNNNVFSGVSLVVSCRKKSSWNRMFLNEGKTSNEKGADNVTNSSFYDLASLTKPLVTLSSILDLKRKEQIKLTDTLSNYFPQVEKTHLPDIQIHQLLSHSAGFRAHKDFYIELFKKKKSEKKDHLLSKILKDDVEYHPGKQHIYSDLGYMLLGYIVEEVTGGSLDRYWHDNVCTKLQLTEHLHFPNMVKRGVFSYVSTGKGEFDGAALQGVVHDDNCRSMGGVAGHAGLFGTSEGVTKFCEHYLSVLKGYEKSPCFNRTQLQQGVRRLPGSNWCLGFDMVSPFGSSSGKYFSKESIGHLGFTGVSFWIDIKRDVVIVFLTNRVLSGNDNREIKRIRPKLHDQVMKNLFC